MSYTHIIRVLDDTRSGPERLESMSSMFTGNEVYREDEDSLVVTAEGGFLARSIDRLFRDPGEVFSVGERILRQASPGRCSR
ncbi:MAG: 16S rRNA U1498 N3-methylase RsmE [Myxococcota bacterium]